MRLRLRFFDSVAAQQVEDARSVCIAINGVPCRRLAHQVQLEKKAVLALARGLYELGKRNVHVQRGLLYGLQIFHVNVCVILADAFFRLPKNV